MKTQIFVGLITASLAFAASAEDRATEQQTAAGETANTSHTTIAQPEIQHRTYSAGNQLLMDLSAKVGGDLDARLQQEVGQEVTIKMRSHELLVSSN